MSFTMQADGRKFLAEMLAGSSKKINGMYVEYGTGSAGVRNSEYFKNLEKGGAAGFARVAVTNAYVAPDGCTVHFDGMVCTGDLTGTPVKGAKLTCATLACLDGEHPENDVLVCTVDFGSPVQIVKGAYTAIHTSMKLGA